MSDSKKLNRSSGVQWLTYRLSRTRQGATLWAIAIAVEKQLPLVTAVDAFASDLDGPWREKLRELSNHLDSGINLADALEAVPGLVPADSIVAIRVGIESGTLTNTLRGEAQRLNNNLSTMRFPFLATFGYLCVVCTTLLFVVSFVMVYIIPKYKVLFRDFGLELPDATLAVMRTSNFLVQFSPFLLPGTVLLFLVAGRYAVLIDTRFTAAPWFPNFRPPPLLRKFLLRSRMSAIMSRLSEIVAQGRPLEGCISTLAKFHPDRDLGDRLSRVYVEMHHGGDCWDAMGTVRLLSQRDVALLHAADEVGNLPWAMRQVARRLGRDVDYRCRVLLELLGPGLLLIAAVVVGSVVISLFFPVLSLINSLS